MQSGSSFQASRAAGAPHAHVARGCAGLLCACAFDRFALLSRFHVSGVSDLDARERKVKIGQPTLNEVQELRVVALEVGMREAGVGQLALDAAARVVEVLEKRKLRHPRHLV